MAKKATVPYKDQTAALILLNEVTLGKRHSYAEIGAAVIVLNRVNLGREDGFVVGKKGNIELHPDFYKSVDASDRKEAEALLDASAKGRELFAKEKNVEAKWSLGKNGNIQAAPEFYKALGPKAKELTDILEKGADLFKGDSKPTAPKAAPAKEATAAKEAPKGPKYTAEEVIAAVQVANDAVKEGKDLAGLTDRQREIVEIKPATRVKKVNTPKGMVAELDGAGKEIQEPNPFAGKVGLTPSAYQSVTGVVFTSKKALENKDIKASDRDMHTAKLSSYEEALASARTSMGLPEKGPEKVQEGPAPEQA